MLEYWVLRYLVTLVIATLVSYLAGYLVKFLAVKLNIIDLPNAYKIHTRPIPRLGGVAIFLGFISGSLLSYCLEREILSQKIWSILLGGTVILLVGVLDDIRVLKGGVPAVGKLLVLFLITLNLAHSGILVNFPFPFEINIVITLIWLVGIISAFNAIDHLDGLASGLSLIAGVSFLVVAIQTGQWVWGNFAAALIGANLGFLRHNFHPASLFMGDGGSFFLGFTLAALGIMGAWSTNLFKASLIPVLILAIPIFDFVWVVYSRQRKGITKTLKEIITYCGQDHLGHRLMKLGFSQTKTVGIIYLIAITTSLGAVILRNTSREAAVLLLIQFILTLGIIFSFIGYLPKVSEDTRSNIIRRANSLSYENPLSDRKSSSAGQSEGI